MGPVPKSKDHIPKDVSWSPLLECPCTDRIEKKVIETYGPSYDDTCEIV